MPKPLNLFLRPPYGVWTVVHAYGATSGTTTTDDLRLETTDLAFVRAACSGNLSINPPARSIGINPMVAPLAAGAVIPDRVSLYLNMQPVVGNPLFSRRAAQIIDIVGFFYEDLGGTSLEAGLGALLDSAVLGGALTRTQVVQELLRGTATVFVPGGHEIARAAVTTAPSTRQFALSTMSLLGPYDPVMGLDWMRDFVDEGQPEVDELLQFAPWTQLLDPTLPRANVIAETGRHTYALPVLEKMRTDIALTGPEWRQVGDHQKDLYLERLRVRAGFISGSTEPPFELNDEDDKNVFQLEAVTEFYANYHDPWSPVSIPRAPAAVAVTGASATMVAGWVELDGMPNLDFIEVNHDLIFIEQSVHPSRTYRIIDVALTGFRVRIEDRDRDGNRHANIPAAGSPWRIEPYQRVDLLDPAGVQATVAGSVITLDGTSDLTRIWPNGTGATAPVYDTIVLDAIPAPQTRVFRILSADLIARTVTVDGTPVLPGASTAWHIKLRPWLVAIDPIGGRISGKTATVSAANPDRVELDPTVALDRVNANFDTIYLPTDTRQGTPLRTYRILEVNVAGHWVRLSDTPALAEPGPWHLQAGISGKPRGFVYDTGPGGARGWDHFEAMTYVVFGGAVEFTMQWNTYTSRDRANYAQFRSTVRGNKAYEFFSFHSTRSDGTYTNCDGIVIGQPFRNYSLKLVDVNAGRRPGWAETLNGLYDGVREARWYFEAATRADVAAPPDVPNVDGKTDIRFHHSVHTGGRACSSAGCIVSPEFGRLRSKLAHLYDAEVLALRGTGDVEIRKLFSVFTNDDAMRIYEGCDAGGLTAANFNNKIVGRVWIIRPDERPLP